MPSTNYLEFLGTGTSVGIPMIGCDCEVCSSSDPRDNRLRASVFIHFEGKRLQIDVGPDFRTQVLRSGIVDIDAVLLTHEHRDHIGGLDDLRPFMFRNKKPFPIYLTARVLAEIKSCFAYAFTEQVYPGAPRFETHVFDPTEKIDIDGVSVIPVPIFHGSLPLNGYRVGKLAYLTDVKDIPQQSMEKLMDLDVLVISALRHATHHSHITVEEALDIIDILKPKKAYLTHISHQFGKTEDEQKKLPHHVTIAYDGLKVYF